LNDSDLVIDGYAQTILCGLLYSCTDHSLVDVMVTAGKTIIEINRGDWNADIGTFPPMPNP
jgi:hypothetical protein